MTTKLTLTIEERVIKIAKKYAEKKGRSLSGLVENYLKTLSSEDSITNDITPRVRRLRGAVKFPDNFDFKSMLEEKILKKHGK